MRSTPRSLRPCLAWSTAVRRVVRRTRSSTTVRPALVLNPLRSEGEAFRLLLYVIAVFAVIVVLIVVLRALL